MNLRDVTKTMVENFPKELKGHKIIVDQEDGETYLSKTLVGSIIEEYIKEHGYVQIPKEALSWLEYGQRGVSSETIFGAITGIWLDDLRYPPSDPDDFNRCSMLIKAVPEWKEKLHLVAKLSKEWEIVVQNWDKLEKLLEEHKALKGNDNYKMYRFMKSLGL